MRSNLVKLAADTDVLRRFARQHIWNAPHRSLSDAVEENSARGRKANLARERELIANLEREQRRQHTLAQATLAAQRSESSDMYAQMRERINASNSPWKEDHLRQLAEEEARRNADLVRLTSRTVNPDLARRAAELRENMKRYMSPEAQQARREAAYAPEAKYNPIHDRIYLHGRGTGGGDRLISALHENNEREAEIDIVRRLRLEGVDPIKRVLGRGGRFPQTADQVLPQSSHFTPSIPLRDVNIANTATGPDAANLQARVQDLRFTPRMGGRTEIEEIGQMVPGAQRILENSRILPGAPVPETPDYVRHAQRRLRGENPNALGHRIFDALGVPLDEPYERREGDGLLRRTTGAVRDWATQRGYSDRLVGAGTLAPPSPAVQQRLQQIVDTHQANVAPSEPARLNRNELHMIDSSFHRTYNPQFPQLLAKRAPSPQVPATPLPVEQRSAFREALSAQPGLTRKQFLSR